jgi:glycosyltransferase involved in cell wall biosynthesis
MKVLMVTPSYYPIVGGSETAIRILAKRLNEIGIQTDVMTYNMNQKWQPIWKEETAKDDSSRILKIPAFNPAKIFGINPLETLRIYLIPRPDFAMKFKEYDIIHFQGEADLSFPLFSYLIRKPKLFTSHANYARFPRLKQLYKLFFPHLADLYIAHEPKLLFDLGVPESKRLVFQSFGVNVDLFQPNEEKRVNNLILFVGRITQIKGLHILIEALPHVTSKTRLVVIGPKGDMKYSEDCLNEIDKINQKGFHKIDYIGSLDETGLVPWYQKAAILIRPDIDGFSGGLTTLEALACATPVIGTGNHVVKNGVNGIIVSPKNARELATAINQLMADKKLRRKYGAEGRKIVIERFSWKKIAKDLAKIYACLLDKPAYYP